MAPKATDDDSLLGATIAATLRKIETLANTWVLHGVNRSHSFGRLPGEEEIRAWSIPRTTGWLLYSLARTSRARTVLEIGTSFGYSTLWLASGLVAAGGTIHTCEIFAPKAELAQAHFVEAELENINLIRGDALETTRCWSCPIDLLFLDADPENYSRYWNALRPWLGPESIVIMDNAVDHCEITTPFMEQVGRDPAWTTWVAPIDHGLFFAQPRR